MPKQKPRRKALVHRIQHIDIEFTQRGQKRRLLRVQRYREPVQVKDIDLSRNPEKVSLLILRNKYGDRLEVFYYKNNPKKGFFSLNGEVIGLNKYDWRRIQSALMKLGKNLGLLK